MVSALDRGPEYQFWHPFGCDFYELISLVINQAQLHWAEIDCSVAIAFGCESDRLTHQGIAQVHEPPRECGRLRSLRGWSNDKTRQVSPEARERAVRLVLERIETRPGSKSFLSESRGSREAEESCANGHDPAAYRHVERSRGKGYAVATGAPLIFNTVALPPREWGFILPARRPGSGVLRRLRRRVCLRSRSRRRWGSRSMARRVPRLRGG